MFQLLVEVSYSYNHNYLVLNLVSQQHHTKGMDIRQHYPKMKNTYQLRQIASKSMYTYYKFIGNTLDLATCLTIMGSIFEI